MADSITRRVGIPGTGTAHWGEHLCAFFYAKTDLLHLVVRYIKAGLEDNEFCLWITEENMEQEALEALERVLPDALQYVSRKQLEILPASKWYLTSCVFDAEKSLANWAARGPCGQSRGLCRSADDRQSFLAAIRWQGSGVNSSPMSTRSTRPLNTSE